MATVEEMVAALSGLAVSRASAASSVDFGPVQHSLDGGSVIEDDFDNSSGFYDATDTYVEFMVAGDLAGDKPVGP